MHSVLKKTFWPMVALIAALISLAPASATAGPDIAERFSRYGTDGAWLIQPEGATPQVLHGAELANQPLSPASSIKPLLALIALQTGALESADTLVPWDGRAYPRRPEWERDMALNEAMLSSSESYFGTLAERIGRATLAEWIARVGYGNGVVGDTPRRAWHDGVLLISANQQLQFIERLRSDALPFAPEHLAAVKAAMLQPSADGVRIFGKTGTHLGADRTGNGWWVGWVEGDAGDTSFALLVKLNELDARERRLQFANELLQASGVLQPASRP
jgi:beta-lactamase class D